MATASASVDSKAELTALLEQWEREQQGATQELVIILTKFVLTLHFDLFTIKISRDVG